MVPSVMPATMIEGARIAGDPRPPLPHSILQLMVAQGVRSTRVVARMCLSTGGLPTSIALLKRSGYPEADRRIEEAMRGWRYRPYLMNGKPVPVCTAVTFDYRLK
jgi:TonB family protein